MVEANRDWELSHKQRICVKDKRSGVLCAALVLYKESELFKGPYPESLKDDKVASRFFSYMAEDTKEMKSKFIQVFANPEKVSLLQTIAVVPSHRGKGLASLLHETAIKLAVEVHNSDFMHAHMLSPETIHLSQKCEYEVMREKRGIDETEFKQIH